MANLRQLRFTKCSLLLVALALGVAPSLFACDVSKISEKLPATRTATAQSDTSVRRSTVRLDFREQKPGTEARFYPEWQVQQDLLRKQAELKKSGNRVAISANEAALKRSDAAIAALFGKPVITEKSLTDAYTQPGTTPNSAAVGVKFDAAGSKAFTALTKRIAGTGRSVGIFLNDRLISAPAVSSEFAQTGITGGFATITGNFSPQEASDLAAKLRGDSPPVSPRTSSKN